MPKLIFREDDYRFAYDAINHLESVMYFPASPARQSLYWDAKRKVVIDDDIRHRGWPAGITEDEYDILVNAPWPFEREASSRRPGHFLISADEERTIKRRGFLAADCLKYLLAIAIHHPIDNPKLGIRTIKAWQHYLGKRRDVFRQKLEFMNRGRQFDKDTHRAARYEFIPVAHFWAAYFDDARNEHPIQSWEDFERFVALAEGYASLAEAHGLYPVAAEKLKKEDIYRVATTLSAKDFPPPKPDYRPEEDDGVELAFLGLDDVDVEADWQETVYELAPVTPLITPLPDATVAELRKEAKGQRKRKQTE